MVIPIRDENPTRRRPVVTVGLIAVNLFVFFALQLPKESDAERLHSGHQRGATSSTYRYAAIPCELTRRPPARRRPVRDAAVLGAGDQRDRGAQREVFPDKNV